jgi:two-component system CheB/CheR fusion protein
MAAIKATTIKDYISYLKDTRDEVELLYKDMLIGVTSFFRDTEAFEELKEQLKIYVQEHKEDEQFRIWISACSTGEEAYSIAIILDEILNFDRSKHIKIFATDVDEDAVKQARAGVFPEVTLANISPERLKRYFIQKGNEFEVKPQLKERVIFSRHDITMDPPFVNVDLVTCRNMLIYFETELQKKIFTTLAYALKHHGLLFLGKSESVGVHTDLFATIDPKSKIFQARTTAESRKLLYPQMLHSGKYIKPTTAVQTKKRVSTIEESIKNTLFEYYEDKCVVIDNDFNVHYIKGNMNDILKFPSGEMHNNILKMLPEKISLEVRSLIYKGHL